MEFTSANPFIPKASVVRYPNSIFEARIHLPGAAAHIDVVPHENFILVTGSLAPRVRIDAEGKPSTLVFTDQPCGVFGRDIPVNLTAGTELVVLSSHQDCDDYIVRYTIRNSITPRANCADFANAAAGVAGASGCKCPSGMKGSCGGATATFGAGPGVFVGQGYARPAGSYAIPPALLGRGPGHCASGVFGYGYGAYPAYAGYSYPYAYGTNVVHGAGISHAPHPVIFHQNGGATF